MHIYLNCICVPVFIDKYCYLPNHFFECLYIEIEFLFLQHVVCGTYIVANLFISPRIERGVDGNQL